MKTEIVDASPTRKEIKIEIEAEEVKAEFERLAQEYARVVTVPGFRKGHAPVTVVRTRFKKEIRGEVLQKLVPQAVGGAIDENGLQVIGEPDIHLEDDGMENFPSEPVKVHAHVEVMPEVSLGEYRGLEAARRVRPVTDETVAQVIENLREASASLQPVEDRASEEGDTVTADFRGRYVNPEEPEDINVQDVEVVLGGPGVLPAFSEHLTGVRPEEVRTFTIEYPEDFSAKGLAGKSIEYTATVTAVRRKELPQFDDEWVKSLGEEGVETIEQLRARVRENLEKNARHESEHRLRDDVLGRLIERHRFEVPETIVAYQANQLMRATLQDMMQRGIDPRGEDVNWEALRDVVQERAGDDVRGSMLLERVADAENIDVSDEEIEAELQSMAEQSRQTVEQVRASLTKQGGERSIADRLRNRKALDFLVQHAAVTEEEWPEEEPAEVPPAGTDEPAEAAPEAGTQE